MSPRKWSPGEATRGGRSPVEKVEAHISDAWRKVRRSSPATRAAPSSSRPCRPMRRPTWSSPKRRLSAPSPRSTASRPTPRRSRWPTTLPPNPSPPAGRAGEGGAAYFYSRDIGRIWRVAEALEYGIIGINEGIISTEIAPFDGMKESGIGPSGESLGLEIRHRGIPRGQIPLHGRHRPLVDHRTRWGMANCAVRRPSSAIASSLSVMESMRVEYSKRAVADFQQMAVYYAP
jgi:hypothetical protein